MWMFLFFFLGSYRLRIEIMLLKAEFEANMSFLEPSIDAMLSAGQGQLNSLLFDWRSFVTRAFNFVFNQEYRTSEVHIVYSQFLASDCNCKTLIFWYLVLTRVSFEFWHLLISIHARGDVDTIRTFSLEAKWRSSSHASPKNLPHSFLNMINVRVCESDFGSACSLSQNWRLIANSKIYSSWS